MLRVRGGGFGEDSGLTTEKEHQNQQGGNGKCFSSIFWSACMKSCHCNWPKHMLVCRSEVFTNPQSRPVPPLDVDVIMCVPCWKCAEDLRWNHVVDHRIN